MLEKFCLKNCHNIITGTYPCIIHCPGILNKHYYWTYFKDFSNEFEEEKNLTIVTWNTNDNYHKKLGLLERSLKNYPIINCAQNLSSPWINNQKMILLNNHINSIKTQYVLGADSSDTIFIKSPKEILDKFKELKTSMLFGCEKFFFPLDGIFQEEKEFQDKIAKNMPYKYLNAGLWIADTEYLKQIIPQYVNALKNLPQNKYMGSEQIVWHKVLKTAKSIRLDYSCEIFQNLANVDAGEITFHPIIG